MNEGSAHGRGAHGVVTIVLGVAALLAGLLLAAPAAAVTPASNARIAAGGSHTCSVDAAGDVYCWGASPANGNPTTTLLPARVNLSGSVDTVAATSSSTCALMDDRTVWCWGDWYSHGHTTAVPWQVPGLTSATSIAVGGRFGCALLADTSLQCWGDNDIGQLGDGTITSRDTPAPVLGVGGTGNLGGVVAIATSWSHACAVKADGSVTCWGANGSGQLGNGSSGWEPSNQVPMEVPSVSGAADVAVTSRSSCALKTDGHVWCWGNNRYGQLGDGTFADSFVPVQVRNLAGVVALSGGAHYVCALRSGGAVSCWGDAKSGQLGDGTWSDSEPTPQPVSGLDDAVAIAAGSSHSCALRASGAAVCWGQQGLGGGRLGNGIVTYRVLPTAVPGVTAATSVTTGTKHVCSVGTGGQLTCWGSNSAGQLGDTNIGRKPRPPRANPWVVGATQVAVGSRHTCAPAYGSWMAPLCWGSNQFGQLGDGGAESTTSAPVMVSGLVEVEKMSADEITTCALLPDGSAMCWGGGWAGQLGNGKYNSTLRPVQVLGVGGAGYLTGLVDIDVGRYFACAVAGSGRVYCWGDNRWSQLGDGTLHASTTPVEVSGLTDAVAVAAGGNFACALKSNQQVACWGANYAGQLGNNGPTGTSSTAVLVHNLTDAVAITAGAGGHACALKADGSAVCWGSNYFGQLGDGTRTSRGEPVAVAGLENIVSISAGDKATCAVVAGGQVYCWGSAEQGVLGTGRQAIYVTPQPVQNFGDLIFSNGYGWHQ